MSDEPLSAPERANAQAAVACHHAHAAEPVLQPLPSRVAQLGNLAPKTLISLARLSTLQVWPDQMETRLSPMPSPLSRRSRRMLHDSAPKTLKSLALLSTLQVWPDEMETRLSPSPTPARPSKVGKLQSDSFSRPSF